MSNEYINYDQVRNGAQEINRCADKMQEIFDSVAGSVRVMTNEENFAGNASNALQAEFEPFRSGFANYVSAVRRFAALYSAATSALEANEASLKQQIDQLQ